MQNEKADLINTISALRNDKIAMEDSLRNLMDRITSFRPKTIQPLSQAKSIIDSLGNRLNDLIAFAKEVFEENHILVDHAKETKDVI